MSDAVIAEELVKTYSRRGTPVVRALDSLSISVPEGSVLGVLGPNGAGKTTCVRILATLLKPDSGRAEVAGIDVLKDPRAVRNVIGLSGQYAAVDETLTGRENLVMFGKLYHLGSNEARSRSVELLERFSLTDAADRPIKTYSGGMRRRLDLAASLVAKPKVLFLDEPTTGLDPRARLEMWSVIDELVKGGATILLTTQYLEEADHLADSIAVIDHGQVIAQGTADQLKATIGGERLEVTVGADDLLSATEVMRGFAIQEPVVDEHMHRISAAVTSGRTLLVDAIRAFDSRSIAILDLALHRPTLDDVFLSLTGKPAEDLQPEEATPTRSRR
jgi:ABC-2 type transport system ATP-binding protein